VGKPEGLGFFVSTALFLFLGAVTVQAEDNFLHNLRQDLSVPDRCREMKIGFFKLHGLQTFTYGIKGATQRGFTHEYPISRQEAKELWQLLKLPGRDGSVGGGKGEDHFFSFRHGGLAESLDIIEAHREEMGFEFESEGEVLEILASVALKKLFPPDQFFITGGVEYHEPRGKILGELDLLVGRNSDCHIEYVGEAKLSHYRLGRAKKQLARFLDFLGRHRRRLQWHGLDSWLGVESLEQRVEFAD